MQLGRLVALSLCLAGTVALATAAPAAIGKVTKVFKKTDLLRGKGKLDVAENIEVAENDQVRTQSNGRVRIVLNDGSILSVGQNSFLTVKASTAEGRAGSLDLRYGKVRAVVSASLAGATPYSIRTNTAVCGVLGTTVFVDATRGVTRVANLSDEPNSRVRVASSDPRAGGAVVLNPGEGTSVAAGRAPGPARRWSPEEVRAANGDTTIP
jgi:ferric-dicitrate binding protein FerR (iron transport regulator)